jgi:hypothetical protein
MPHFDSTKHHAVTGPAETLQASQDHSTNDKLRKLRFTNDKILRSVSQTNNATLRIGVVKSLKLKL